MAGEAKYDLVVIGGGPGGYVASVRARQLNMKVACVEKETRLGGICLNVGCIPSKALLDSSENFHRAREHFAEHGVRIETVGLDLDTMMARKRKVVEDLTEQVRQLLTGHGVEIIHGEAEIVEPGLVQVTGGKDGERRLLTRNILLATGSEPLSLPGVGFDGDRIVTSTEALSFPEVPGRLGIVGGGYIGLELGSLWRRLGSEVVILEMAGKIAGPLDGQISRNLERILKQQGLTFKLNTRVRQAEAASDAVRVRVETEVREETLLFDKLLVAVGRKPLTRGLGLEKIGVSLDGRTGQVLVDEAYATNVPGVYAIGDLIPGPMLAHKASAEGIAAVEGLAGQKGDVDYDAIPAIIYTWPEVASVGLTEEQVKERGIPFCTGVYPFSGSGRARCMGEKDGLVKIIVQADSDRILGVHILGPRAADMIGECALAVSLGLGARDMARTVHGHPTFGEALQEAAKAAGACSIYAS